MWVAPRFFAFIDTERIFSTEVGMYSISCRFERSNRILYWFSRSGGMKSSASALFILGEILAGGSKGFIRWAMSALKTAGWIPGGQVAHIATSALGATIAGEVRVTGSTFYRFNGECGSSFVMMTTMQGGMDSADAVPLPRPTPIGAARNPMTDSR